MQTHPCQDMEADIPPISRPGPSVTYIADGEQKFTVGANILLNDGKADLTRLLS